jgi:hypothetical protein
MHWWHGVHYALWGRPEILENNWIIISDRLKKQKS